MPCSGFRELEEYHSLYQDSRINPDNAHFLLRGLKSTPVKLLSSGKVCKPWSPCISLLCFQALSVLF